MSRPLRWFRERPPTVRFGVLLVVLGLLALGAMAYSATRAQDDAPASEAAAPTAPPVGEPISDISTVPEGLVSPLSPGAAPTLISYSELIKTARQREYRAAVVDGVRYWVAALDRQNRVVVAQIPGSERSLTQPAQRGDLPPAIALPATLRDLGLFVLAPAASAPDSEAAESGGGLLRFLMFFAIGGLLIWLTITLVRRARGGGGGLRGGLASHSRSRKQARVEGVPPVRFADVAGCDEAIDALRETLRFLAEPEQFTTTGARMPKGIILFGPPGTGKTLLAKATAGEAGVPFYETSGSEFVEMYVGVGAARVRDLFARARKHPEGAIVFIDEIDAIGQARGGGGGGNQGGPRSGRSDQERDQTLNQLLTEMDGFRPSERVIVMASTNRVDMLDRALMRPGRFDRHVQVDLPDRVGRLAILQVHGANKRFAADVAFGELAATTAGCSGADLENLLNEAAIVAAVADRGEITRADLTEGHLRAVAGRERVANNLPEGERRAIAWHEAGHALAAELCPTHPKAERVTIVRRGRAMGLAFYPHDDRFLFSPQDLFEQMIVGLAGRAAEELTFGRVSSGAANDLEQVNDKARTAIQQLGFSGRVGQSITVTSRGALASSPDTHNAVDAEIGRLTAAAYDQALELLGAHRDLLDRLAEALLSHSHLDRAELDALLGDGAGRLTPRDAHDLLWGRPGSPAPIAVSEPVVAAPSPPVPTQEPIRPRRAARRPSRVRTVAVGARALARRAAIVSGVVRQSPATRTVIARATTRRRAGL